MTIYQIMVVNLFGKEEMMMEFNAEEVDEEWVVAEAQKLCDSYPRVFIFYGEPTQFGVAAGKALEIRKETAE